jgi:3-deoxy-D-manno-octulosonate 8-phosphate phosphatase (KDO 8-P phosphatase)
VRTIKVKFILLDIDGVLTDGQLILDQSGNEYKAMSYHDIDAISRAQKNGITIILLTGEDSPIVDVIAKKLKINLVYKNAKDKLSILKRIIQEWEINIEDVAYIGDSVHDIPVLETVKLSFAPANAEQEAFKAAHYKLLNKGGQGAVSEAIKLISGE